MPVGCNSCTDTYEGFIQYLKEITEPEILTVERVLMPETEFKNLPEFIGF